MRARPSRPRDHGERRPDRGGHVGERGGRALHGRARGPQPGRGPGGRGDRHHGGRGHGRGERERMRRGDPGGAPLPRVSGWPGPSRRWRWPPPRSRRAGSSPATSPPAAGATPTRSCPAACPVVNLANGTERNHQPDESVTVEALEQMLDVTLALVAAAGELRADGAVRANRRQRWCSRASSPPCASTATATRTAPRRSARWSRTPARWPWWRWTADALYIVRQPREAVGEEALLELPAGKLDPGEDPLTHREARAGGGDRARGPELAAPHELLHLAGLHGRGVPRLSRRGSVRGAGRLRRGRAHRDRAHSARPSSRTRSGRAATRRALVGLLWLHARLA